MKNIKNVGKKQNKKIVLKNQYVEHPIFLGQ
jgi:hypothetical protein